MTPDLALEGAKKACKAGKRWKAFQVEGTTGPEKPEAAATTGTESLVGWVREQRALLLRVSAVG